MLREGASGMHDSGLRSKNLRSAEGVLILH